MNKCLDSQQPEIVLLWETSIPNAILNVEYKEEPIYKNKLLVSTSKVSIPTLSVYRPKDKKGNGTAIIIFPGGGYKRISMYEEGEKVGKWLSSIGITAFVLKYRLPSDVIMENKSLGPLQDAQESVRYVREHAQDYKLNTNKIGVLGFSAGGHLASTLVTHYKDIVYKSTKTSAKPDFLILIYPVISMENTITHKGTRTRLLGELPLKESVDFFSSEMHINSNSIKSFIVHASDDLSVPVENSIKYYLALKKNNIPAELHLFEKGGHGFGLRNKETNLYWETDCINWLKQHCLL
ncbi:alpha/beta hydrolase [Formosa sediminum]|uniref:Alpha/beta hydrolase n=1 Tax=Formosa sediminum TaxID=2594004 RepID=A0A516GUM9_9FLAO|nr:alpha/beta hydrolase [Formosa sediminum]QDO95205.1 alpha/beta hydrolase [Formosa sediminum]